MRIERRQDGGATFSSESRGWRERRAPTVLYVPGTPRCQPSLDLIMSRAAVVELDLIEALLQRFHVLLDDKVALGARDGKQPEAMRALVRRPQPFQFRTKQ